jgi:hypothetical protein
MFHKKKSMITGICCAVAENCTLLGYYAVSSGNFLPTFQDSPKMALRNYHYSLGNNPEECRFQN